MRRLLFTIAIAACGDNRPVATLLDAFELAPDAGVADPDGPTGCCVHYPDDDAIRACANFPSCACGVITCPLGGDRFHRVNACGPVPDAGCDPMDAGVDGPS